jgi:uncharacterized protein
VILGLIGWALGIDPRVLIGGAEMMSQNGQTQQQADAGRASPNRAPSDEMGHFVSAILGSTEAEWTEILAGAGKAYKPEMSMPEGAVDEWRILFEYARSIKRSISTQVSFKT